MSDTIQDRERAVVEEFGFFDDWMGKYEYLIEQGRNCPPIDEAFKTDAHKIHGCQSQVWVHAAPKEGRVWYTADSDALITKGLVALLIRVLSGQPAADIAHARLDFLDEIGLQDHLSPTRKNGLAGMVQQMKLQAIRHAGTPSNP